MDINKLKELAGLESIDMGNEMDIKTEESNWDTQEAYRIISDDEYLYNNAIDINIKSPEDLKDEMTDLITFVDFGIDPDSIDWGQLLQDLKNVDEDIDINNGYNSRQPHQELGDHGDDYFPQGQTSTPQKRLGPSAAQHGNNPMYGKQFTEENAEIHKNLVYEFRQFKQEFNNKESAKHIYREMIDDVLYLLSEEFDTYDVTDAVRDVYKKYNNQYSWLDFDDLLFDVKARLARARDSSL